MGKEEDDMEVYNDKQTTTVIATPMDIMRLLHKMMSEQVYGGHTSNPIVQEFTTVTKTQGEHRLVIKLKVQE